MKTYSQFINEASNIDDSDIEGLGQGTGVTHRGGDKIGRDRKKTAPEKKRVKAIGGGKTAPAKSYKKRTDAGSQRSKGRSSERLQQPTQKKGVKLSAREQQRKARAERLAAKSGGKSKAELEKAATKLLIKKKDSVSPNYKPSKASGYTRAERRKLQRSGDRLIKDISKKKDKPASHYDPKL
jgi:hypothetical protein